MDSVELDLVEKKSDEASDAELLLSDASDPNGLFDTPLMSPRVGDEYQAEISPMLTLSQLLQLSTNPIESQSTTDAASSLFLIGPPMPITWICNEAHASKCFPVPGLSAESWSDFEVESFTLGLYIFGKNLVQVQRFMESKDAGQIQCFYYGRFYKSPRYCKWVDCRKMRNKKCVMGSKIFTGFRQQELLSRLLPHLSEEAKNTFQDISNALVEERMSLEEYVSTLKRMVGIRVLVEAVGIGKGKEDLTTLITDMAKSHRQRVRAPELPSGKACSSLSSADIIKFLTSDFRLSKARSNDLFWEAVWPRLLAKGWHSEQPNDICTAPKNSLVFLMPGVKKFSRRKLTNGIHYFDSVSDVLRKVASEPRIIDLEVEEARPENSKEENDGVVDHVDDHKDKERPRYLKPQGVANVMKFTVIDTSLQSKVKELRSLPAEEKHSKSRENSTHLHGSSDTKTRENGDVNQKVRSTGPIRKPGVIKRQRLNDVKQEEPTFVLSLPASKDKSLMFRECSSKGKESEPLGKPHLLLIDLNLPHVPMEEEEEESPSAVKSEPIESSTGCLQISGEVPSASGRRLSTRTRPLTTKALEALEIGLLSIRQSRKRASPGSLDRKTRHIRQDRSDEGSYGETGSDGIGDGKMDVVTSPLVQNNETVWPVNC